MRAIALAIAVISTVICSFSGCETTRGAAQDISNTGSNIQRTFNGTSNANETMNNTTANTSQQ